MQTKTFTRIASLVTLIVLMIIANFVAYTSTSAAPAAATNFTFTPVADAYVLMTIPDSNHGTSSSLRVDNSPITRSYMRFSVSGLNGSMVQSAKLRIYANSSNSIGFTVSTVADNTWDENTITYNNSPELGSALVTSTGVRRGAWTEVDITSYIQTDGTYDLALTTVSNTNTRLASREAGENAPQLVISTDPLTEPTFTLTLGLVDTSTPTATLGAEDTQTPTSTLATIDPSTPTATLGAEDTQTPTSTLATIDPSTPTPTLGLGDTQTPTSTLATIDTSTPTPTLVLGDTATPTATLGSVDTLTPIATVIQGQNLNFVSDADTYIDLSNPTANYGAESSLRVDASTIRNSYLRFTVQGLGGQPITQAHLSLYANESSNVGFVAHQVIDNTWDEMTMTYANAPQWGSTVASVSNILGGNWITLDVTSYVTGEGTYSFGLSTTSTTTPINFDSRETGADAPRLIITVNGSVPTAPAPTSTLVPTSMPIATATTMDTPTPVNTAIATPTSTQVSTPGRINHVFVVVMENHSYKEVWNTSSTPYTTSLANSYTWASNYFAITHPSLPNYLDLYGGGNYGITTDCSPSSTCHISAVNLADNLEVNGLTWKGYMESMPSPCYLSGSGTYAPRHNPFIYFDDIRTNPTRCASHVVPFSAFSADLASASTTPNYSMIVPNLCNDTHDCTISAGDIWLKNHIPSILNSPACTIDTCLLILTWDEDDGSQNNQVLTIFAGSGAKTGGVASSVKYNHFSMLRTIENIFGLPAQTGNDAAASPMNDLLR